MTRRAGLSLIEVLAALFIMGIGLISLFTLFPYGALQMASAVKDDRTAQCASAADAYMRVYWKERVLEPHPNSPQEPFFRQVFPQADAMDDPNADANGPGVPNPNQKPPQPSAPGTPQVVPSVQGISDPSYPLVVDPMGWVARAGRQDQFWVADSAGGLLPRRNLFEIERFAPPPNPTPSGLATARGLALRTCSLLDGLTYSTDGRAADATGLAAESSGGAVQRELRYNWLWVLQRPNNSDRTSAKMSVVVFDKRAHLFAPNVAETAYAPAAWAIGATAVSFAAGGEPLGIKKGSWLLDGTIVTRSFVQPGAPPQTIYYSAIRNANFYRVVSVTENAGAVDVELHQPLKPDSKTRFIPDGSGNMVADAQPGERRFILLSGVADVFERNPLANSSMGP